VTKDTRVRPASPQILHVHSKNQGRERIHTNQSEPFRSSQAFIGKCVLTSCRRTATLEDRMHHLETLIQAIPSAVFAAGGTIPGGSSTSHLPDSSASPSRLFCIFNTYISLLVFLLLPCTYFLLQTHQLISRLRIQDQDREARAPTLSFSLCLVSTMVLSRHLLPTTLLSTLPECLCQPRTSISTMRGIHAGKARPLAFLSWIFWSKIIPSTTKRDSSETSSPDPSMSNSDKNKATNTDWFPNRTPGAPVLILKQCGDLLHLTLHPTLMDRYIASISPHLSNLIDLIVS
jgi:hypothetical protein